MKRKWTHKEEVEQIHWWNAIINEQGRKKIPRLLSKCSIFCVVSILWNGLVQTSEAYARAKDAYKNFVSFLKYFRDRFLSYVLVKLDIICILIFNYFSKIMTEWRIHISELLSFSNQRQILLTSQKLSAFNRTFEHAYRLYCESACVFMWFETILRTNLCSC